MKKLIYMGMGLFLCLSAALFTGCDKPNELEPDNGGGSGGDTTEEVYGFIKGVVSEKGTGTLISMATVELLPTDKKTQTDGEGAFSFDDLDAGTYQLRVSKEGYVDYTSDFMRVDAEHTFNRTISLEKGHAEIQILDTNDKALSELYLEWVFEGAFKLKNSGNVVTTWEISEISEEWLACSKQSGELAPGASERIDLTIDKSKLPSEENEAVMNVVSEAGEMQLKVRVKIFVPEAVGSDYVETAFGMSLQMVAVTGGTFSMGATSEQGSDAYPDEKPVHSVTLEGFYIGKFEVTQAQWEAVMGTNPCSGSSYGVGDNYPVYYVSWDDAVAFCEKLSQQTGKTYRLPTEAEWEYAARGGNKADGTKYAGSNNIGDVAWYEGNSWSLGSDHPDYGTHPVGQKKPNGLGLYDMSGNVWEWCSDWYNYDYYSGSPSVNPQGPSGGSSRVFRGGSWSYGARDCRVSNRDGGTPDNRFYNLGFRVVCER